jgi:hypothetical protein
MALLFIRLALSLLLYPSAVVDHPFHVSVCEITHNADKQRLEIIHKIFWDDLEDGLSGMTGKRENITSPPDPDYVESIIKKYLTDKFSLKLDGKAISITYLGSELEDEAMWVYMEVPKVSNFTEIEVFNNVLMEVFDDQMNLIHVTKAGKIKSLRLSKRKFRDVLKF